MPTLDSTLQKESLDRYLTYALSVISGRALPDVRDGLKPVQRRILYAMHQNLRLKPGGSHKKSATVIGEVLGKFHPHGDVACYEAMVRMAQDFSLRYPLVDGQGNFGSLDGDSAAAYRYTEVKLREIAVEVVGEIDQETVPFRDNFDGTTQEPVVLPSRIPNMIINGASGIAVGMATNIPPHNLRDTVRALIELSNDPDTSVATLANIIKGPDFPTGCLILNSGPELRKIYETGRGFVRMQGEWQSEELGRGKQAVIVTSIPYTVNKAQLVEQIANLIIDRKLPQLVDVRDESTDKVRIVLELASGASAEAAMAFVFKNTTLESSFSVNLTALVPVEGSSTRPELLSLKDMLRHFLVFREEVVERRLRFERKVLLERIHILEGLVTIFDDLDQAIRIVRKSTGRSDAAEKLRKHFKLTEIQAFAVVDMRIYQLSRTNIEELRDELAAKSKRVSEIEAILKSKTRLRKLVRDELEEIEKKFGDNRLCKIVKSHVELELNEADYVVKEDVYAIVTKDGWLKRIRQNNEVGTTRVRDGDAIVRAHPLTTLDYVLFFTNFGFMYVLRASDFPASSGYGSPIQKLLKFRDGELLVDSIGVKASQQQVSIATELGSHLLSENGIVVVVSARGLGYACKLSELDKLKRSGKRILKLRPEDQLAAVCTMAQQIALVTQNSCGLVIKSKEIPERNAPAVGVTLMGVRAGDRVVGCISFKASAKIRIQSSSGREKDISSSELTVGRRGLKGSKLLSRGEVLSIERV